MECAEARKELTGCNLFVTFVAEIITNSLKILLPSPVCDDQSLNKASNSMRLSDCRKVVT